MEDEEAVRVVLGGIKSSGQTLLKSDSFRKIAVSLRESLKGDKAKIKDFNASKVLDEALSNSNLSLDKLKKEYKKNGINLLFRDLPNDKVEMLFHARDDNMLVATTEKILREVETGSKKYNAKLGANKSKTPLQERIDSAKEKQKILMDKQPKAPKVTVKKSKEKSV